MNKKYVAFISYSRKDKRVADWLHEKLEHYVLPDKTKAFTIFPFDTKYFRPVFLDTQDLHVEERPFTEEIMVAIRNSSFMIVLCSRNSENSPFVDKEIRYFLQTHDNNLSRIVPLFIDEVDGAIPPAFKETTIMERHFPIYNARLSPKSEANNYCFYQIVSYILKLDFSEVYNRYEISAQKATKKRQKVLSGVIVVLVFFMTLLSGMFYNYKVQKDKAIERRDRLIELEKKVFPQAVVHGYEENFLTPVIEHLKSQSEQFSIYILMPRNKRDIDNRNWINSFEYDAKMQLGIDSVVFATLPTNTSRGSRILKIYKDGRIIDGVYLDYATTTTTFLDIADFKKRNREYRKTPLDSILSIYSYEFIEQTKEKLNEDSVYVKFYLNRKDLLKELSDKLRDE